MAGKFCVSITHAKNDADKATVGFGASNYPRYVQLAVKFIW